MRKVTVLKVKFFILLILQTAISHSQEDESLSLTFEGHKGPVYAIAVSPDGMTVASSGEDKVIHVWDIMTGDIKKTYEGHLQPVKYLEFSNDGSYLASAASTRISIRNVLSDELVNYKKHVTHVYNIAFNNDASRFLSTSLKPKFVLWDREGIEVIHEFEGHSHSALSAAWSPDGKWIASGSADHSIRIWDVSTRETVHTISAHGESVLSLDFSSDGKLLASASQDENVKIWDVVTGKIHSLLSGHEYAVVFVRFSPDGKYLVSASYDMTVRLWELATGKCIYTFVDQKDAIYQALFTPDGKKILACSNDGSVKVYEMSPRFIAEYYFFNEMENDLKESGLAGPRRKGESRDEFRIRSGKAGELRQELYLKYYNQHIRDIEEQ